MTLLAPLGLGFGVALPLLLLLYLLKVRRTERVVSSVLLWETFQRDLAARDPWQRLRWSILLALQLILLGVLAMALARPSRVVPTPGTSFLALVVDTSPSMLATDVSPNRFEAARAAARDLVGAAPAGTTMALIEAGATARVVVPETTDLRAVDQGLAGLAPTDATAESVAGGAATADARSIEEALRIAGALARARSSATIHLFSDGAYSHPAAWDELAQATGSPGLRFHPIGTASGNRAITVMALSPGSADVGKTTGTSNASPQLFARIQNFDARPARVTVTLDIDGKATESRDLSLSPEESRSLFFDNLPASAKLIQLRLSPDDTLVADKTATLVQGDPPSVPILLVSRGNLFLQKALQSIGGIAIFQVAPRAFPGVDASSYAVLIFDGYAPDQPPTKNAFLINPTNALWLPSQGTLRDPPITLWRGDDPTLAYVDLQSVHIARATNLTLPDWAHPSIESNGAPLAFVGTNAGQRIVGLTFDVQQSNLPLSAAFPILVANVVRYLTPTTIAQTASLLPGEPALLRPPPGVDRIVVDGPAGGRWEIIPKEAVVRFAQTTRVGLYQATEYAGSTVAATEPFAVNLFDAAISDVRPRANLVDRVADAKADSGPQTSVINEYAPWLLGLALPLLILEWWWFHRK